MEVISTAYAHSAPAFDNADMLYSLPAKHLSATGITRLSSLKIGNRTTTVKGLRAPGSHAPFTRQLGQVARIMTTSAKQRTSKSAAREQCDHVTGVVVVLFAMSPAATGETSLESMRLFLGTFLRRPPSVTDKVRVPTSHEDANRG